MVYYLTRTRDTDEPHESKEMKSIDMAKEIETLQLEIWIINKKHCLGKSVKHVNFGSFSLNSVLKAKEKCMVNVCTVVESKLICFTLAILACPGKYCCQLDFQNTFENRK